MTTIQPDVLARAMRRIESLRAVQIGADQQCEFCGAEYRMGPDDPYRPGSVCADCWPRISAIEARADAGE